MSEKRRSVWRKLAKWFGVFLFCVAASIGVVYIYLAFQTGETAIEREVFKRENSRPLVFAHRGGGGLIPENTLEAFVYSARMGVDVLELDIHSTSDGTLVVMHDAAVDRTTDGRGRVNELTLEAVKKLNAGYFFSPDGGQTFPFRNRKITVPTLREIFDALPEMTFNIEPKQHAPSIIKLLCALVREQKMIDKVIVGSFNQTTIDDFRRECPEVATSASPSEVSRFLALSKAGLGDSYSPPMQALQVPVNLGSLQVVSKEFVETAHRRNLKVHVWTINETADMQRLLEIGVDGIMTDYPDRLLTLLGRR
ncbi:MAG: glycerophosphodiester phosphodiesterase [Acidobacteriota bacterium]|nr:glycerophosphodiester phosphodiesterase [Acidobacteriota bacterium]